MIALSRRRPLSISIFAAAFLAAALLAFLRGMLNLPEQQFYLQQLIPAVTWSRDTTIIWQSAWLSIALIPIAMVWLAAVRFARWMVTLMALPKALGLVQVAITNIATFTVLDPLVTSSALLSLFAVAMLFTPASNRWFRDKGGVDPAVFE
jgi:hypothetical protein